MSIDSAKNVSLKCDYVIGLYQGHPMSKSTKILSKALFEETGSEGGIGVFGEAVIYPANVCKKKVSVLVNRGHGEWGF